MKIAKPASCVGCPLHSTSSTYTPDEVVQGSKVYVLGSGDTTHELWDTVFFPLAGLIRGENVSIGQAIRCEGSDVLNPAALREAAVHCARVHQRSTGAQLVIAQGGLAWGLLTQWKLSLSDWRGFLSPTQITTDDTRAVQRRTAP